MVNRLRREDPGDQGVIGRVARQLAVGRESLHSWVKQADTDAGSRPGVTTDDQAKLVELEAELKRQLLALYKEEESDKKKHQDDLNKNDKTDVSKQLENGLIEVATTLANTYMELLAKEDAYRYAMAERSLSWNEKIQNSEAQSRNEQLAEQRANQTAQEELEKEKAEKDKKRAEQQLIINAVVGASKAIAENPPPDPEGLIGAGIIMAQLGIQEGMLASAPAYAEGFNPDYHLGWVGDGGEPELRRLGNSFSVTPSTPTLTYVHKDEHITPFSQIGNLSGNLGANLKAPSFSGSSSSSGGAGDYSHIAQATANLHNTVMAMHQQMSNIQVSLDTHKLDKKMKSNYYKRVAL